MLTQQSKDLERYWDREENQVETAKTNRNNYGQARKEFYVREKREK